MGGEDQNGDHFDRKGPAVVDLRLIGGSLSLFGALILLTILTAQIIRRIRIGSGPVGNCFCQLLAVGIIEILLYGWTVLNDSYPEWSIVTLFCWVLLIRNRWSMGTGIVILFMIMIPVPVAAFFIQWIRGGTSAADDRRPYETSFSVQFPDIDLLSV